MSADEDRRVKQLEAGNREAARMWRAWRTIHQMVQDRGYTLAEEEVNMSLREFKDKHCSNDGHVSKANMKFSAHPSDDMMRKYSTPPTLREPNPPAPDIGPIWCEFLEADNVGIKHLRTFAQYLSANNFHTGILITSVNITPSALKIIPAVANETRIETFNEQDLLVNITHHELVPKHVLLSKEEKSALLERYRLKDTQLPRIQMTDPVARYMGLRRGQVVKIIRKSETAGRYASYRLCV
ncbi:hypothetical protein HYALB_00007532 [Hymenoscyphus albidus]|uniref:DNA-directed RNA polymerases I, II, and III subunit RPABC1 n=1 Tax=Hymenoscyphus albidus TaxID=595503 RepID=A0A9N9Q1E5_9HELO|nr:hypothetical protein HYALB_00007532 [Hymenoscyphus albidus]